MSGSPDSTPREQGETAGSRLYRRQTYYRSKTRAVWLAATATVVIAVILPFWVAPGVPFGMTADDYNYSVTVALLLAMSSTIMALLAFLAREPIAGEEGLSEAWHSILGKPTIVRNRRQFHDRLARECKLDQPDRRRPLSLLLIRVQRTDDGGTPGSLDPIDHIADTLLSAMRSSDVMGTASVDEIGILAIGALEEGRDAIRERFERTLAETCANWAGTGGLGSAPAVSMGASTNAPGSAPDSLLAAARQSLAPVVAQVVQAA